MDEVLASARHGDLTSRERLIKLTRPQAVRWASALVQDAAEDVAQEALLEVWRTLDSLREPGAYLAWVHLIVRKHADRHRRRRTVLFLDQLMDLPDGAPGPATLAAQREEDDLVRRAVAGAPASDRQLLDLRYRGDWSDADLADLLGISPGAVRKRLFDARRRLKPSLEAALDRPFTPRRSLMPQLFGAIHDVTTGTLETGAAVIDETPLVTGVRALDGLLPWPRAGLIELAAPVRVGAMVLLGEVLNGLLARGPAAIVAASRPLDQGDETLLPLTLLIDDPDGQPDNTVVFRGPAEAALAEAAAEAGRLAREGRAVLLVVDHAVAAAVGLEVLERLPLALAHGSVTVVHLALWLDDDMPLPPWSAVGTRVVLSRLLAQRGIYPAIDLLASSSSLADPLLAETVREQLQRAEDLQRWVAQPFMTTELHTGLPGERVTAHEAVTQLRAALA